MGRLKFALRPKLRHAYEMKKVMSSFLLVALATVVFISLPQIEESNLTLQTTSTELPVKYMSYPKYNHSGPVTRVIDGDTFAVDDLKIRLKGVTCDEKGEADIMGLGLGDKATAYLTEMISGKNASCLLEVKAGTKAVYVMSYDRVVGNCVVEGFGDVGAVLIRQGLCGRCNKYDNDKYYADLQKQVGKFKGYNPSYCWD